MVASTAAKCPLFVRQQWSQFLDMSLKTLSKILIAPVRKRALPDNSAKLTSLAQALPRQILKFSNHSKMPDYANGRPDYRFCDEAPGTTAYQGLRSVAGVPIHNTDVKCAILNALTPYICVFAVRYSIDSYPEKNFAGNSLLWIVIATIFNEFSKHRRLSLAKRTTTVYDCARFGV